MKILRIIPTLNPSSGGPVEGILQITPQLSRYGHQSTVATLDVPDSPWLQSQPFQTVGLGPVIFKYGYRHGLVNSLYELALKHDIVIIDGIWQYHSYAAWRALYGTGIPYFVYTHGMLDPWFKYNYPLKHILKWCYWPWADYRVLRDAKAVLFTTNQELERSRSSFWLYDANELVVGYGTSPPTGDPILLREQFLDCFPQLRDQRILLFLGRIHPKKGVDLLIEAFSELAFDHPRLHLVIAGPDQVGWKAQLQERSRTLGIADRITWPGMICGNLKWGAFHAAELFCLPSHQENFGIVVAEALACGLPVAIAKPVNISSEVLSAGAGFVHEDTISGTTDALKQWVSLNATERLSMSDKGLHLFRHSFDLSSVAKHLLSVLES